MQSLHCICNQIFDTNEHLPVKLLCNHTICLKCALSKYSQYESIPCSFCNQLTNIQPEKLQKNNEIIDQFEDSSSVDFKEAGDFCLNVISEMKAFKKLIESKGSAVEENFINNYEIYNKFMQEAIKLILNEDVTQIQNTLDFIQGKQVFSLQENKDEQKPSKESSQSSEDEEESNKFQILFSEQKGPQIILSDGNKVSTGDKTNWNTVLLDQKIVENKQYTIKFQIIKNSSVMIGITDKCNFKSHLSRATSAYYLYCNDGIVFHKKQKIKKYSDFDMENVTMIINSKQGYLKFQCKGIPENDLAAENILFAGQNFYPAVSQSSGNTVRILESYIQDL